MPSQRFDVIILAAGRSSRSAIPKPLRSFGSEPWVVALARMWGKLGASRVLAVWNPAFPVPDEARFVGLHTIPIPETDLGPLRSLQIASSHLRSPMPRIFITPIDCPPPDPAMTKLLTRSLGNHAAVHPEYRGKGGHPVLVARGLLTAIAAQDPARTRLADFLKLQGALRLPDDDPTVAMNWNDDASWQAWLDSRADDRWDDDQTWRERFAATLRTPKA